MSRSRDKHPSLRSKERPELALKRRHFLASGLSLTAAVTACSPPVDPQRYTQEDIDALAAQREREARQRGRGPFGEQRYQGYRGLASLPWFELDGDRQLVLVDESIPSAIDFHAHLGISVLFRPRLDLLARTERVIHLLDCDGVEPGCELDLDIYINGNFDEEALKGLGHNTLTQALWGNAKLRSHTIPNLLHEMHTMNVSHSVILPIKVGLPFGDHLTEDWRKAINDAGASQRLIAGLSVHHDDPTAIEQLHAHAATGARVIKLHPTVQQFYPDHPKLFPIYEAAQSLGLIAFFHGGRAGIEPEDRLRYALPRHYEGVLKNFPKLPVVLGHAGARDSEAMLELALRYDNAWLGLHGQSVTMLDRIIDATGGRRLLFGTDWPWYHIAATLAKILICTDSPSRRPLREALLRGNALELLPELTA